MARRLQVRFRFLRHQRRRFRRVHHQAYPSSPYRHHHGGRRDLGQTRHVGRSPVENVDDLRRLRLDRRCGEPNASDLYDHRARPSRGKTFGLHFRRLRLQIREKPWTRAWPWIHRSRARAQRLHAIKKSVNPSRQSLVVQLGFTTRRKEIPRRAPRPERRVRSPLERG